MELPKRKSIRLKDYDYSQNGAYFITICTHNRECLFSDIVGATLCGRPNNPQILMEKWLLELENKFENIKIDKYVVMPNHIHLIITICRECVECIPPQKDKTKALLPKIIQTFKSSVTKEIIQTETRYAYNARPTIWQSRFHEHIIRNKESYQQIWQYIDTNPLKWSMDCYHS